MALLPCYKKSMENEYHLLRTILLETGVPDVYRKVLTSSENRGGMRHALAILNMLHPSLQKSAVQQMGLKSGDRRWKVQSAVMLPCNAGGSAITSGAAKCPPTRRCESDWQERQWDTDTPNALCHLPVRRLVSDATQSEAFNLGKLTACVGTRTLSDVHSVDLVRLCPYV